MKPNLSLQQGQLRPTTADDLDGLLSLLHDEHVRRYLCDDTRLPRETVAGILTRSAGLESQGLGLWVVEHEGDAFAGVAGLEPVSEEAGAAPVMAGGIEPVIALYPRAWGRGLASEALNTLIDYARDVLRLAQLVAAVDEPNARSHKLMERCGFTVMGKSAGPAHELVLYKLTLEETG